MRHIMTAGVLACAVALTTACGGEADTDDTTTATETSATPSEAATTEATPSEEASTEEPDTEPDGTVVDVTVKDGQVSPNGDRVEATAGEPITFLIDADAPGELHVHSEAGTEIAFGPGVSEHTVTIDRPGVVEVELHDPELVVVQLEVR